MNTDCRRPFFSRFWLFVSPIMDKGGMRDFRRQLLAELEGEVVEVGAGNAGAPVPVTVTAGTAERIPCADASADAVVCSLMLCSVGDQEVALREARRVQSAFDATVWPRIGGGCHMAATPRRRSRALDSASSASNDSASLRRDVRRRHRTSSVSPFARDHGSME